MNVENNMMMKHVEDYHRDDEFTDNLMEMKKELSEKKKEKEYRRKAWKLLMKYRLEAFRSKYLMFLKVFLLASAILFVSAELVLHGGTIFSGMADAIRALASFLNIKLEMPAWVHAVEIHVIETTGIFVSMIAGVPAESIPSMGWGRWFAALFFLGAMLFFNSRVFGSGNLIATSGLMCIAHAAMTITGFDPTTSLGSYAAFMSIMVTSGLLAALCGISMKYNAVNFIGYLLPLGEDVRFMFLFCFLAGVSYRFILLPVWMFMATRTFRKVKNGDVMYRGIVEKVRDPYRSVPFMSRILVCFINDLRVRRVRGMTGTHFDFSYETRPKNTSYDMLNVAAHSVKEDPLILFPAIMRLCRKYLFKSDYATVRIG